MHRTGCPFALLRVLTKLLHSVLPWAWCSASWRGTPKSPWIWSLQHVGGRPGGLRWLKSFLYYLFVYTISKEDRSFVKSKGLAERKSLYLWMIEHPLYPYIDKTSFVINIIAFHFNRLWVNVVVDIRLIHSKKYLLKHLKDECYDNVVPLLSSFITSW